MEGAALKVKLRDEVQTSAAQFIVPGQFCTIRKMALKKITTDNLFQGSVGGTERLVVSHSSEALVPEGARKALLGLKE